ncbi:hypothetical protein VTO42DRAFT_2468 [Malbranchea cinnamomea]
MAILKHKADAESKEICAAATRVFTSTDLATRRFDLTVIHPVSSVWASKWTDCQRVLVSHINGSMKMATQCCDIVPILTNHLLFYEFTPQSAVLGPYTVVCIRRIAS